ncbi:helix-turn-helix domain-containing protein [Nocardiopsis sp. N85]|uniref:PucR family transcriptional regulator n=1 Tax=Nocardiopsis sp. N85 TaxID=3029400 RepID=UPI00237F94BF|nr:PucR family transcriptional regulator [Nocardiopsis sp. N85]MDE3722627.1 helix-turn-helix domain-containing protein [Nocardiopsis sp. N85]
MTHPLRETDRTDPFSEIPPEVGARLRHLVPPLVEEVLEGIHRRIGKGDGSADPAETDAARGMLDAGVRGFLDRVEAGESVPDEALLARFRAFGAREAARGYGLDRLHTGMRVTAAVAWRCLSDDASLARECLGPLGEAVLLFQEEIGAAAAEGHSRAGSAGTDVFRRRRSRLLEALLAGAGRDPAAVAVLARDARWRPPERVAVALPCPGPAKGADTATRPPALPPDVLVDPDRPEPCALVPDPEGPGRLRALERSLRGSCAVLGPSVPLGRAPESLERARELAGLVRAGVVRGEGLVRWDDHLLALLLRRDTALVSAMSRARLAPLAELRPPQRERMAETLLAWLESGFNANEAAERLRVHPQTVRYRMRRLEELFGARLRDPRERFELELVLRARRLPGVIEED